MKLTQRVLGMAPSLPRKLFDMAKEIDGDVIDLTLGDPDVPPPANVRAAACAAIEACQTRYSQNAGLYEARKAVAAFQRTKYGRDVAAEDVILTVGAMGSIFQQLFSLVEPGDEVIVPAPYWVNYVEVTKLCGAVPVVVSAREENGFSVTAEQVAAAITPRTRVVVVNSPNNPTGRVLREDAVRGIAELAVKHDLFVISDEVYRSLVYDGIPYLSIFDLPEMKGRCSVIDAVSKQFSMTGYRLGYTIGPRPLVETMTRLQENINACAPLPSQYAAIAAYGPETDASYLFREYAARRQIVVEGIHAIPGLSLGGVDAAFYAFVNISATGMDSQSFAYGLLKEQRVAVVPGLAYGDAYDNFIRIAFTVSGERLREALGRLRAFTTRRVRP
ncbi:MAG: aminotransferase class I/II-fold pyridoxal phosphate-dependent enzyme [Kiritimatiellae bacterium]|nr:aminotransferase class I/II-fold pyridoxal phosphate-dependent enzyme [Kiritimatiellia bacterium]